MTREASHTIFSLMMTLDDAATYLEALGNPTRLKIYRALVRAGEPGLSVNDLNARVGGALSTLSHHLRKLVAADLVCQDREGTTLRCRTNYALMNGLLSYLASECCADAGASSSGILPGKTTADGETLN